MDAVQYTHIRQALLEAQEAIHGALAMLATVTPSGPVDLVNAAGQRFCQHPNKVVAMGGYWDCPDCGASGREEKA